MALFERGESKLTAAQHFTPPTARERRAEVVQRLQVGLFGLAAMLLLVGLADIVMQRARLADASAAHAGSTGNTDPLADLGVIPSPAPGPAKPAH